MKNNKLLYLLIIILTIWCIVLTAFTSNQKQENSDVINEIEVVGFSTDFTKIVDEYKGSVVSINANGSISTGFIYKQDGSKTYIISAYHGVADATSYLVSFESGYTINATLIGKNIYADIAILQVDIPYEVKPINLGDVTSLNAGEFVISIGTPISLEYSGSVELGMISSNLRTIENNITVAEKDINYYLDVIQLSSNLKPGYSGSPIINMNGDVVGMVTMCVNDNFNFAITANEIKIIANKIIMDSELKKYQLGMKCSYISSLPLYERTNLNLPIDINYGLYVNKLMDNSLALLAGVKTGDVILSINDIKINDINDYLSVVYDYSNYFKFDVLRNGEQYTYRIDIND